MTQLTQSGAPLFSEWPTQLHIDSHPLQLLGRSSGGILGDVNARQIFKWPFVAKAGYGVIGLELSLISLTFQTTERCCARALVHSPN